MRRRILAMAAAVLLAGGAAGDALLRRQGVETTANYRVPPASTFSLSRARSFRGFPVYSLGPSFQGLPLVAVLRRHDAKTRSRETIEANYVSFVYGDCNPEPDGCAPPLEVQTWPACTRVPADIDSPPDGRIVVRGAPASFFEGGRRLEVVTGSSTVVIFGSVGRDQLAVAATRLRGVNVPVRVTDRLRTPARGGVAGTLRCEA